jgi:FMN reductase
MPDTDPRQTAVRVVGICGSLRPGSYTQMAIQKALEGAEQLGAETELIDLRHYELVFANGSKNQTELPGVAKLCGEVKRADGIILGTPEYHGGFSGVLKNAIDLMGFDEFEGKMVGLVGVSGGAMGAFEALLNLRNIGRALHAWVIPEQVAIPVAWKVFDNRGGINDEEIESRLLEIGRQVTRFARLHKCKDALEFLKDWEQATPNPGGE